LNFLKFEFFGKQFFLKIGDLFDKLKLNILSICRMTEKRRLLFKAFGELTRLHYEIAELYIYPPDAEHMRHVMMFEVK